MPIIKCIVNIIIDINEIKKKIIRTISKQTYLSLTCNKYDIKQYAEQLSIKLRCAH